MGAHRKNTRANHPPMPEIEERFLTKHAQEVRYHELLELGKKHIHKTTDPVPVEDETGQVHRFKTVWVLNYQDPYPEERGVTMRDEQSNEVNQEAAVRQEEQVGFIPAIPAQNEALPEVAPAVTLAASIPQPEYEAT